MSWTPERWAELKHLFHAATDRPRAEWPDLVARIRARDHEMGNRLEALLDSHTDGRSFLESPAVDMLRDDLSRVNAAPGLEPGMHIGPYEILGLIGAGGMGEVYRARDQRLGRDVAIKVLPRAYAQDVARRLRLEREARAIGMLNHPNAVVVHDVGIHEGAPFIVSELLEGESLRAVLNERRRQGGGAMMPEAARQVARQIADGMAAAHARGIVHRDLKPENVMIMADGRVKIIDFGVASITEPGSPPSPGTGVGAVVGTPGYMAPEQLRGEVVGPAADVFAAGTMLHEMLTGRHPSAGGGAAVPTAFAPIVERCLRVDPTARFASGRDLAAALAARPRGRNGGLPRPAHWRAALLALLAGLLAAAVLAAFLMRTPGDAPGRGVVLLPTRVSGGADVAFLSEAVPASLSTYLARVEGLGTTAPPTAEEVARVNGDLARIASAYQATACLLTAAILEGDRLTLTAQLVEPATRRVIWSEQYEGRREAYLQLVQRAARGVESALRPTPPTTVVDATPDRSRAELAFQIGEYHRRRYAASGDPMAFEAAEASYRDVLAADGGRADAAARLSGLYQTQWEVAGSSAADNVRLMEEWARRALEIDHRSALGWAALARIEMLAPRPEPERLLAYALKSAAYGPGCSDCQGALANVLAASALVPSLAATEEAHRLDPLDPAAAGNLGVSLLALGRMKEATRAMAEARSLDADNAWPMLQEALVAAAAGRNSQARRLLEVVERTAREGRLSEAAASTARAATLLAAGDRARGLAAARHVRNLIIAPDCTFWDRLMQQMLVTPFLAQSGHASEALDLLEAGAAYGGTVPFDWMMLDPRLASIRSHPRFRALARRVKPAFERTVNTLTSNEAVPGYLASSVQRVTVLLDAASP